MTDTDAHMETNRRSWDQCVPIHLQSHMYGEFFTTLRNGGHCLDPIIVEEVGDVAGKSLLHLQCHVGHDTLSWARLGARVTGLDFSLPAIEAARNLATELELDARFVGANVYDALEAIDERFDLVFASVGVFCWIPDLPRWMRVAASMLKKGGVLYVMDGHPFADWIGERTDVPEGIGIAANYFDRGPHRFGPGPSYASDSPDQTVGDGVEWTHTLGDFVNAVIAAGFRIEFLHEHPSDFFQRFKFMQRDDDGRWRLPGNLCDKVPMVMSMRAVVD